jgi:hypothetical protein
MIPYVPKLQHATATAFICIVLIAVSARAQGRVLTALTVGALIFALMTALILWWIALENINRRVTVITEWMHEFNQLDDEGRAAVAFQFPTVRYRMSRGEVREMFEDTNVPIELFRLFLQTSNTKYVSPERDWSTAERPRRTWLEIMTWLQENNYILADSAAGSHSWLWNGNSYKHLFAYWMAGHRMKDMNVSYATETE